MKERILTWIAWRLPKKLVYWCFVRVHSHASFIHPDKTFDELKYFEVAKAWDQERK